MTLAAYLAELHDARRASSNAAIAVAAACFRAKSRQAAHFRRRADGTRVLAGYRRTAGNRGRGQARAFGISDLAAVLANCHWPRRRGRGVDSEEVLSSRGPLDEAAELDPTADTVRLAAHRRGRFGGRRCRSNGRPAWAINPSAAVQHRRQPGGLSGDQDRRWRVQQRQTIGQLMLSRLSDCALGPNGTAVSP